MDTGVQYLGLASSYTCRGQRLPAAPASLVNTFGANDSGGPGFRDVNFLAKVLNSTIRSLPTLFQRTQIGNRYPGLAIVVDVNTREQLWMEDHGIIEKNE